jgi:hypothetical protein
MRPYWRVCSFCNDDLISKYFLFSLWIVIVTDDCAVPTPTKKNPIITKTANVGFNCALICDPL